ncbi:MAG: LamG domain-containing protein, partial [Candidatus Omnitrophica bacterium]|nr:LamG domain-containing protein [Candidatus Omnitrophota bacterium]
ILEVGAFGIRIGGEVTQSPNVRFYYGKQDGGTDPEKWSHVRDYGEFSDGPIEVSLFGLEPVTEYYLRARVSNGVGDSWADESLHVATLTDEEIEEASTVALWLFDETDYSYTTLLDAEAGEYDLRLDQQGRLVPGRFGNALKNDAGPGFSVHYSVWSGIPPAALWGPTIAPGNLLKTLSTEDWTLEFWLKLESNPTDGSAVLHLGNAYDPGFELNLNPQQSEFEVINAYTGSIYACPTQFQELADGQWHHVAFGCDASGQTLRHFLDGQLQGNAVRSTTQTQPIPPTVIPPSLLEDPTGVFDGSRDYETFRQNRFNLSLAEDRHGSQDLSACLDEIRFSNTIRYSETFNPPGSFSKNYGALPPPLSQGVGLPPLFDVAEGAPLQLGARKHVFLDEALIDEKENIELTVNPPTDPEPTSINFGGDFCVVDHDGTIYMIVPDGYASAQGIT